MSQTTKGSFFGKDPKYAGEMSGEDADFTGALMFAAVASTDNLTIASGSSNCEFAIVGTTIKLCTYAGTTTLLTADVGVLS